MAGERAVARQYMWQGALGTVGLDVLPYQLALGVSCRRFDGQWGFRIYVGPFKVWGGIG